MRNQQESEGKVRVGRCARHWRGIIGAEREREREKGEKGRRRMRVAGKWRSGLEAAFGVTFFD